jgi:hypothetical protein
MQICLSTRHSGYFSELWLTGVFWKPANSRMILDSRLKPLFIFGSAFRHGTCHRRVNICISRSGQLLDSLFQLVRVLISFSSMAWGRRCFPDPEPFCPLRVHRQTTWSRPRDDPGPYKQNVADLNPIVSPGVSHRRRSTKMLRLFDRVCLGRGNGIGGRGRIAMSEDVEKVWFMRLQFHICKGHRMKKLHTKEKRLPSSKR